MGPPAERVVTIPNLVSLLRLLGIPVFLYLLFVLHAGLAAAVVLAVGGTTDWVDGYLARRLGQVSRLGELLDPVVDRLYIATTIVAFTVAGVVPWPFTAALIARDAVMAVLLLALRSRGFAPPPVHYVGKSATFVLLGAFPLLLAAATAPPVAVPAAALGWALAWWGLALYWAAAAMYLLQAARGMQVMPAGGAR